MIPNTYYKPTPNSDMAILPNGQAELGDNSKVVAANGAAVNTHNSMNVGLGTLFSVETKGEKTIVKVAEGQVEIFNTNTWESYTAQPGEEVEVVGEEINKTALFDPKYDEDFQFGFLDWMYQYFNLINAGIVLGVIVILLIVLKIIKHFRGKSRIKELMK